MPDDMYSMFPISSPSPSEVSARVSQLVQTNGSNAMARTRTRDILNGGPAGVARLVGRDVLDPKVADMIPVANFMLKANDRLAQKIGEYPIAKVDPDSDDEEPQRRADVRMKMLASWDRAAKITLSLHQLGRWLCGYGFAAYSMSMRKDKAGGYYPHMSLRDPYNTYPSAWTVDQQPRDCAFRHVITIEDLARVNPGAAAKLNSRRAKGMTTGASVDYLPRELGGVLLAPGGDGSSVSWANQGGDGVEVYEYVCDSGTYWSAPGLDEHLAYVPNPLECGPMFEIGKRFSFDQLQGQYDQLVGLMAAVARLNLLAITAVENGVNAETVIIGQMANGQYQRGPGAINYLLPGSSVQKLNDRIPFEALTQLDKMVAQLRSMATYPITDDAVSPNSFVTGQGLEELTSSVDLEVREYQMVVRDLFEGADSKRLELMEKLVPSQRVKIWGVSKGSSFATTMRADRDIKGEYVTRRVHGILAGFDEPNKIIVGTAMADKGVISTEYLRDNIHGLEGTERIKDQIKAEQVDNALMAMVMASVSDPASPDRAAAIKVLIEQMPEGDEKDMYTRLFITEPEEQAAQANQQVGLPPGGGQQPAGPIPPVTTVLNRLSTSGAPTAGVQTVSQSV